MVQALADLIKDESFDKEMFLKRISTFSCKRNKDVELFLKNTAVDFEKKNLARTYFLLNDYSYKIDGYFSLSIKPLIIQPTVSKNQQKNITKSREIDLVEGYLLGQLARDDNSEKNTGEKLLSLAIERIRSAQKEVGGRLVFLDCVKELEEYYTKNGFKFLQANEDDKQYIQMYCIL